MSISSIVNLAAGKISELLVEEAKLLYGVEDQVRSLQREFIMMQSFLIDMEAMDEEGGDERSRTTIKQIRKIAYDAEDVIESYILEVESKDLFKRYLCFCSSLPRTHQFGFDIADIKASIDETMESWKKYGIIRSDARQGLNTQNRVRIRPIAYSHAIEDHVVGLDEDINKLVEVLTSTDEEYTKNVEVVSFVGMGGSGKTTLARKLFNHESVIKHFDCLAWVSVSQQWVAQQILVELLRKARGESMRKGRGESMRKYEVLSLEELVEMRKYEVLSLEELVEKLHQFLERKRYLIVLDDVWTKRALEEILPSLPLRSDGRKIIVTTQNRKVVDFSDVRCFIHEPRRLTEEESWELFTKIALIHRGSLDIPVLEALGKDILKKCQGLPLAVIALAGILGKKESVDEWEKMKKAVSSRIMEDGSGTHLYGPVNKMLALSYYDFPHELKPCFLYLAQFPEDYEIPTTQLIQMWIAEGFITSDKLHEGDTPEDVGRAYLDELVHRCMVQIARKNYQGKVKRIRVHDLVRDLCIKKAKKEDFLESFFPISRNMDTPTTESRRVANYYRDGTEVTLFPTDNQHIRSLFCGGYHFKPNSLKVIYQNFRLLRVLLLQGVKTFDGTLPSGIGRLIHLRYLGLRHTNITRLPSSIGKLRNLVTLDYRDVILESFFLWKLKRIVTPEVPWIKAHKHNSIPDVVWEIEGLRHLYLTCASDGIMEVDTLQLHTLKNLQTLWGGSIGGSWMLKELPRLSPSVRKLSIRGITSEKQLEAAFQCPSIVTDRLYSLDLMWIKVVKLDSLESIIHSQHLRKLRLHGRMGDRLAGCGIQFPTCINKLVLNGSRFGAEAALVALGKLPHLIILKLWPEAYTGTNWTCSAGEFPQLKKLLLYSLGNLEEWSIERGAMPQLGILSVLFCKKLSRIPEGLKFITTLQELHLRSTNDEFNKRIRGGEDAHIIQHVPLVNARAHYVPMCIN